MAKLTVRNPVATSVETRVDPAPRLRDLDGKRIGLYWNIKAGGDVALEHAAALLKKKYPAATFSYYQGDVGASMKHATAAVVDRAAKECDAMVGTTAD